MKSLKEIRTDLKDIRYFYTRQAEFEIGLKNVGSNTVMDTVKRYNAAVKDAPPKLYDVYVSLYIRNLTQEALAAELGYAPEHVWVLNNKLLKYFQERFK